MLPNAPFALARLPLIATACLVAVLAGCGVVAPPAGSGAPQGRVIVPQPSAAQNLSGGATGASGETPVPPSSPHIALASGDQVLQLISANLDLDPADEQILVVQAAAGAPIRILVADYDGIRQVWQKVADYATQATSPNSFRVEAEDILGDFIPEIVAQGIGADSLTTLDVLRRVAAPSGTGASFVPIVRVSADRSITIERHRRPQAYQFGQKYDESFPIIVERSDPASQNPLDVVRETYHWRLEDNRYVKTLEERVPSEQLAQKQLAQLFSSAATEQDYQQFLKGPWYRGTGESTTMVFEDQTLQFSDGQVQEAYAIDYFTRWGNTVRLDTHNMALQQIKKWITIVITSPTDLHVDVRDTPWIATEDPWSGEYLRLTTDLQRSVIASQHAVATPPAVALAGIYRAADGTEIAFDAPAFTWVGADGKSSSGGFALSGGLPLLNAHYLERDVPQNAPIVTFKFVDEGGVKSTDKSFLLEYKEKTDAGATVRTLSLTPVTLTVRGAVAMSRDALVLEQIEMSGEHTR